MVGGTIPSDVWNEASADDKLNIHLADSDIVDKLTSAELDELISYEQQIHPADQKVLQKLIEIKSGRPNVQPDDVSPESSQGSGNNTKSLICECTRKTDTKEYTSNQML